MFNIGFGELVLILLIAFLVVGPKDLPRVGRAVGRGVRRLRGFANEVREAAAPKEQQEQLRQLASELSEVKKQADALNPTKLVRRELSSLDPLSEVREQIRLTDDKKP